MRIAIVGNGAIGNTIALNCEKQQFEYSLLTRDNKPLSLDITDVTGKQCRITPTVISPKVLRGYQLLILPLKAYQIIDAIKQLSSSIDSHQVIVLLHNGMGTIDNVKSILPNNPVIVATTSVGAYKTSTTQTLLTGTGETQAGWVTSPKGEQFSLMEQRLSRVLAPCQWVENIHPILWRKLAINAAINPLTALYNIKNGVLLEAKYLSQIEQICFELAKVMNALNYDTSQQQLFEVVTEVALKTASNYSSMNRDLHHNRPTEIDFINGYVVNQARKLNIAVPFNQTLQERVATNQKF